MAQFDVYKTPSKKNSEYFPYLVNVQHEFISEIETRIVIPLGKLKYFKHEAMKKLTPEISHGDEEFLLLTPQIASIPSKILLTPIGSLQHIREEIIASMDFAITGI